MKRSPLGWKRSAPRDGKRAGTGWLLAFGISLVMAAALPLGCGDDTTDSGDEPEIRNPEDFLPEGTGGVERDGSPRVATDDAGLQDIINGGYEVYTLHGFREMVEQRYAGTVAEDQAAITIRIYDQTTTENAVALLDDLLGEESLYEEVNEIGDEDHRFTSFIAHVIRFRRDEYFVELEISPSNQNAKDLAALLAADIDDAITSD